jgi:hypothetical protein
MHSKNELCDLSDPRLYELFLELAFQNKKPLTPFTRWQYYSHFGPKEKAEAAEKNCFIE